MDLETQLYAGFDEVPDGVIVKALDGGGGYYLKPVGGLLAEPIVLFNSGDNPMSTGWITAFHTPRESVYRSVEPI